MSGGDELAAAGQALDALQQAVSELGHSLGESLDLHRLRADVARVCTDLELVREAMALRQLAGASLLPEPTPGPEADYDPAFWADAEDDGTEAFSHPSG